MPVQTTYAAAHDAATEGQVVDLGLKNIKSKVAEGSDIPFGRAVVRGTLDTQCKLPSATGQGFLGFSVYTSAWSYNASDEHLYAQYRECNIIDFGEVYLYTEQAVVPGDPVYFRHTADTAPLNVVGRVRKDTSGGDADLVPGATFESTTSAGGYAKVKLTALGIGLSVAPDSSETITASGAIGLDTVYTYFDSTSGAQADTLADGVEGQIKVLMMIVDGGNVVVTPAHYADGTTITFNDAFDACALQFTGTSWKLLWSKGINSAIVTVTATSGAIPITASVVFFDSTLGASTSTLADGYAGQRIPFKMLVDGGDQVLTPAHFLDGTTITFDDAGDSVELLFDGTNWGVVGTPTATVA